MPTQKKKQKRIVKYRARYLAKDYRCHADKLADVSMRLEDLECDCEAITQKFADSQFDEDIAQVMRAFDNLQTMIDDLAMCLEVEADDLEGEDA